MGLKKGLILEGGAMRGLFSAGVLDVLMENGIGFDGMIGVSAGAAFGCNYKSGQIGRTIRYNKKYAKDKRFCSFRSFLRTGDLFGADFCYRELPESLDIYDIEAHNKNPMAFYVVACDMESGEAVYADCSTYTDQTLSWIRASASMPLVSRPVAIGEKKLLDGGIADSIPLSFFEGMGYERNLLVLTKPKGYRKKKNSLLPLFKLRLRRYPNLIKTMAKRHEIYNQTIEEIEKAEKEGRIFIIRPPEKLPIGHISHDPDEMQRVYEIGRRCAEENIEALKRFLSV